MQYIELLIKEKISSIDQSLDLQGADRKMLQLACKDFGNYMKFNNKTTQYMHFDENLEKLPKEELSELESFLTIWTAKWMKKWQERIKLLIGNNCKNELFQLQQILAKVGPMWQKLEFKQELIDIVVSTLINNGEICASDILAEHAVKLELANNNLNIADKAQALIFLNKVMRRANDMAKNSGPLMFIEVGKAYFNSATTSSPLCVKS